ncbi:hypothetical protein C8F04DRAFT_45835 [Mycena alexandri]|uniref:Uncharacterized protein n=1 Tax=Mycena alexandri TaxID=1745969 RepID=A0AAD6X1Z0_9AGAR|nr:hypothetical protein C8F04DRAFT_45835 [Mycena alexandri]
MGIKTSGNKSFSEFSMNALNAPGLQEISLSVSGDPLSFPLKMATADATQPRMLVGMDRPGHCGRCRCECSSSKCCVDALIFRGVKSRSVNRTPSTTNTSVVTMPYLHTFILGSPFSLPHCILHLVLPKLSYLRIESMLSRRRRIQGGLGPSIFDDANWSGNNPSSCLKIDINPSRFTAIKSRRRFTAFSGSHSSPTALNHRPRDIVSERLIPSRCFLRRGMCRAQG